MHAATHAATSHWSRSANSRSSGGSTVTTGSRDVSNMEATFTIIGLAFTALAASLILMGINGPYQDRTGYYIAIGIASGVIVLAVAYLIYLYVRHQRQTKDEPTTTSESKPELKRKESTMPMLPITSP